MVIEPANDVIFLYSFLSDNNVELIMDERDGVAPYKQVFQGGQVVK